MRGKILAYDDKEGSGIISGDDGNRYSFVRGDLMGGVRVAIPGKEVDFQINGDRAVDVFVVPSSVGGEKNKFVAALLAFFLGVWGIHKFYLGQTTGGIILLICGTIGWVLIVPGIVAVVIALIEFIIYLTKTEEQFHEDYVVNKKQWF